MEAFLNGLMSLGFLGIFLYWSAFSFTKMKNWIITFLNFMFSIIIGFASFSTSIPLSPFVQLFIILINMTLFIEISFKKFKKKR